MAENNPGEDKAWEILSTLKPEEVCRAASVSYDAASESYAVTAFGMEFSISAKNRSITSSAAGSDVLLRKLGYFFKLSVLWYLVSAKDIACTGRPVKLQSIRGGDIFTKGSHVLPLEPLAGKYGKDREGFIGKGLSLGGELVNLGDAALRLFPLPRVPVVLSLWLEDEEFPARADLLFDSTCDLQLPTDIIWSVAMMSALVML
jgi:Domain of unknown function (DUF3786)